MPSTSLPPSSGAPNSWLRPSISPGRSSPTCTASKSSSGAERWAPSGSARHTTLGQSVAIKFIHPQLTSSREALRRFQTEAKAAAKLKSRHVAQVYDDGVTAIGTALHRDGVSRRPEPRGSDPQAGRAPPDEVIGIIREAAQALDVAHAAGVVHRDLKPDNIMLSRDPEAKPRGYTVKLVDFGIAKLLTDEAAVSGSHRRRLGAGNAALHGARGPDRFVSRRYALGRVVARRVRVRGDGRQGALRRRRHRRHRSQGVRGAAPGSHRDPRPSSPPGSTSGSPRLASAIPIDASPRWSQ